MLGTTPARSAASASCGKAVRSPTTPRWISMVRIAVLAGAATAARSTGTAADPAQEPDAVRAPPLSVAAGTSATMVAAHR